MLDCCNHKIDKLGGDGGDGVEGWAVPGVASHLSSPACQNTGEFGNKLLD